jgi:hypothetical protein
MQRSCGPKFGVVTRTKRFCYAARRRAERIREMRIKKQQEKARSQLREQNPAPNRFQISGRVMLLALPTSANPRNDARNAKDRDDPRNGSTEL